MQAFIGRPRRVGLPRAYPARRARHRWPMPLQGQRRWSIVRWPRDEELLAPCARGSMRETLALRRRARAPLRVAPARAAVANAQRGSMVTCRASCDLRATSSTAANKVDTSFAVTNMHDMTFQHHRHAFSSRAQRSDYFRLKEVASLTSWEAAVRSADMVSARSVREETGWRWLWNELIDPAISCGALIATAYILASIFSQ